ncbi:unnamed protein product [Rhizoctonia solani]|uniref:Uncharacterized protein n=1 Tax=Rhizoctonia solani TaxID=456999 RepID=A0A8H3GSA2_9AGAM|nr:unnamed protein product [Rhizoctonia solani]
MSQLAAAKATPAGHLVESRPVLRAPSRAGSATSRVGADPDWLDHVQWDGEFHPLDDVTDGRPEVENLKKIVEKSIIVPKWMADIESAEWVGYYKHTLRLRDGASRLSSNVSPAGFTFNEDDKDLSFDVRESLAFILHIQRHAVALRSHVPALGPMETDRRHPMDTLGSLVWDLQSDDRVVYRTESTTPDHSYVLHWVTEYQRDNDKLDSQRQVAEGLVSALYQRRAYGFPNHFVFGTVHHSRTIVEVLAATWVRSDEPANSEARLQKAKTANAVPPEDQRANPGGNTLQEGDTTCSLAKTGEEVTGASTSTNPTTDDIQKYNKIVMYSIAKYEMTAAEDMLQLAQIVMYSIATYNMAVTEDMLQLYLLMRHTLTLAQQYKDEIVGDKCARVRELLKKAKQFYDWPPPPRPQSNRGTKRHNSGANKYKPPLTSTSEHQGDDMSIDPCEDSEHSFDSEELEPPHNAGPTRKIAGNVASYTLKNYAYEEDAEACGFGNPHSAPVSQTA